MYGLALLELAQDFVVFGEAFDFVFAEDELAVSYHIKNATSAGNQARVNVAMALDCRGQTGRLWFVVSLEAVCD